MAYDKRNLLLKIIEIQELVLREKKRGVSQRWIYRNHIKERYFISEAAFEKYLARNAKKELKDLDKQREELDKKRAELAKFQQGTFAF